MTKIGSCNIFAIITAVKHRENPCEVSAAVKENLCEANTRSELSRILRES